jgi:hypothetical protein
LISNYLLHKYFARLIKETRGIIAGTFRLAGATGKSEGRVNGVFEPSGEFQNNFPVYRKKGDTDTWIELVSGASGWRWYLKPTANKGPESSICFAYLQLDGIDVKLPTESTAKWTVHTASGWVAQDVKATSESSLPLPASITSSINEGLAKIKKQHEDKKVEVK